MNYPVPLPSLTPLPCAVVCLSAAAPEQFDRLVLLAPAPIRHPEDLGEARKLFIVARGDTAQGDQLLTDIVRFLSAR